MVLRVHSVETFDPEELALLSRVYEDAWDELARSVPFAASGAAKEAAAVAIFDMARAGQRDPELLWCRAMREGKTAAFVHRVLTKVT